MRRDQVSQTADVMNKPIINEAKGKILTKYKNMFKPLQGTFISFWLWQYVDKSATAYCCDDPV